MADTSFKFYPKLKKITKDGSYSYCDGEIKERFVDIVPFLPQMTVHGNEAESL